MKKSNGTILDPYDLMKNLRTFLVLASLFSFQPLISQPGPSDLVWPGYPERPRIRHVKTISSLADAGYEEGFFSKLLGALFGSRESKSWLVQPVGITVDDEGTMYVADPGAQCVHIINTSRGEYSAIAETKFGPLLSPVGVALTKDGTLFVSDSQNGRVIAFDDDRDPMFSISEQLIRPTGLCVNKNLLYVVDAGRHAVVVFDSKGRYRSDFGVRGSGLGEFNFPVHLAVDSTLAVVDALNYRVQEFFPDGKFSSSFGQQGSSAGSFASPKSVARDSDGNRYVTDALMDNIQIFNRQGQLLLIVGRQGNTDGKFSSPSGIAIDRSDRIYVVDTLNKRIQIFEYLK